MSGTSERGTCNEERHHLTAVTGTAGLGLGAPASVAYRPEAIAAVLSAVSARGGHSR
ncbi:hypothetical protein [Amycolatopsis thermoflava]|uniref:hypothetical protein n=1 Tax=Amycolatopsis thermoflava TaxID=84480 RepID=UPI00381BAFC2